MKTVAELKNDEGTFQPNPGSSAVVHIHSTVITEEAVAKMSMKQVMDLAEKAKDYGTQIHESIFSFYAIHGSISGTQLDVMRAFVVSHAAMFEPQEGSK